MSTTITGSSIQVGSIDLTTPLAVADGGSGGSSFNTAVATELNSSGSAPMYACRAWVNFDPSKNSGGGTDSANTNRFINSSGNVTSVLKTATGVYTVTFTTAMPDANFSATASAELTASDSRFCGCTNYTTTTVVVKTGGLSGGVYSAHDGIKVSVVIFR